MIGDYQRAKKIEEGRPSFDACIMAAILVCNDQGMRDVIKGAFPEIVEELDGREQSENNLFPGEGISVPAWLKPGSKVFRRQVSGAYAGPFIVKSEPSEASDGPCVFLEGQSQGVPVAELAPGSSEKAPASAAVLGSASAHEVGTEKEGEMPDEDLNPLA